MKVFNFSHPLSTTAVEQLTARFGAVEVVAIPVQLDMKRPLLPQVEQMVKPHSEAMNGTEPFCIVLPEMAIAAVAVASAVSGFAGSLPMVVELRMAQNGTFEVNDVINFQMFRNEMRTHRWKAFVGRLKRTIE